MAWCMLLIPTIIRSDSAIEFINHFQGKGVSEAAHTQDSRIDGSVYQSFSFSINKPIPKALPAYSKGNWKAIFVK